MQDEMMGYSFFEVETIKVVFQEIKIQHPHTPS
jgi:hypothetical protein